MPALPCPSCASPSDPYAQGPEGRKYSFCPACRLVSLDSAFRLSLGKEKARYLFHENGPSNSGYAAYLSSFIESSILPFARPPARVLDYGSGPSPVLSSLLSARGYSVSSWDPHFAPDASEASGPFDVVAAHEVIEHCPHPLGSLGDIAARLVPGGVLSVSTLFRPEDPGEFLSWWYRQDATHVSFFSEDCLADMCGSLGFELLWSDGRSRAAFRLSSS